VFCVVLAGGEAVRRFIFSFFYLRPSAQISGKPASSVSDAPGCTLPPVLAAKPESG
jgi:hypothetical protein